MKVRSRTRSARQGFTLVEVIAVLVVLGVLAVSIAAGLNVRASVPVESDILRSHLGYAQSLAMANNTADWSVAFTSGSYTLLRDNAASPFPWPGTSSSTYVLPGGVTIQAGLGLVEFDEWGAPVATHTVSLSDGTQSQDVVITGFTGLVP